ncbi:CBS domain-containing protein, partial [Pseudoalteromonas sp. S558]|uniref:CBS domain-containing protein n=1 Tax=Pseudoalteromonas sp. S558 TaxID=2066515 RepID=UPI00207BC055
RTQNISHRVSGSTFVDEQPLIELTSPALKLVKSFTQKIPVRAQHETTIESALKQINAKHSDIILVTADNHKFVGIVSSA